MSARSSERGSARKRSSRSDPAALAGGARRDMRWAMSTSSEAIAAAQAYEDLHVPALMAEWAPRVLDAAQVGSQQHVLDLACGTGIVARTALHRVGPHGQVGGVDALPGMIALAQRLSPGIVWHHGRADELPFDDASYDAVVCQFGLMFFPDRPAAIQETLRVLKPGGG